MNSLQDIERFAVEVGTVVRAAQNLTSLLSDEGVHLELYGSVKNEIYATAHWTDWRRVKIKGDNIVHCFEKAIDIRTAWEKSEAELTRQQQK